VSLVVIHLKFIANPELPSPVIVKNPDNGPESIEALRPLPSLDTFAKAVPPKVTSASGTASVSLPPILVEYRTRYLTPLARLAPAIETSVAVIEVDVVDSGLLEMLTSGVIETADACFGSKNATPQKSPSSKYVFNNFTVDNFSAANAYS